MDSILETYREQWAPLIEPDDWKYSENEIMPTELDLEHGHSLKRIDFQVINPKG